MNTDWVWLFPGTLVAQFLVNFCFALLKQLALRYNFLTSCSLETRSVIWPGKLSEVLLKRRCLWLFNIVPKQVKSSKRKLVEARDMQSIPHYSVSRPSARTAVCWCIGTQTQDLVLLHNRVRVFERRRVPPFWTHAPLSKSSPWSGIRAVRSHPHFTFSSASP